MPLESGVFRLATAAVVIVLLAAGCEDAEVREKSRATANAAKNAKDAKSKTPGLPPQMVAAVAAGKSASAVGVHFSLRSQAVPGSPLTIDFAVVPRVAFNKLNVHFEAHSGLTLDSGAELAEVSDPPVETVLNHQVTITPSAEGVYLVTATVETEGSEGTVSRIFSVPVIVTAPAVAPAPAVKNAQAGGDAPKS